jgi:hypothetical protein
MTRRHGGHGQGDGRGRCNGCGSPGRQGRGLGYSSKPKTIKLGLCKELEGHIFDYGGHGAANTMRVSKRKSSSMLVSSLVRILPMISRIRNWWF